MLWNFLQNKKLGRVFVRDKPFHHGLMLTNKAGAYKSKLVSRTSL
jgi:hypothetical protein